MRLRNQLYICNMVISWLKNERLMKSENLIVFDKSAFECVLNY